MTFTPSQNPTAETLSAIFAASKHRAARRIIDPRDGTVWCWPAEQATHAEGAAKLAVPYDRPAGMGDILTPD